jgi:hypothetical protein
MGSRKRVIPAAREVTKLAADIDRTVFDLTVEGDDLLVRLPD